MIDPQLAAFLEEGVGIHVGTRDAQLRPGGVRGLAARVEQGGRALVVYVSQAGGARIQRDLDDNGQIAVTFGRPVDERSCQVKGTVVEFWEAAEGERVVVMAQWDGFMRQLEAIGIPRAVAAGWVTWPALGIRFKVTALFEQTPGPQAGLPLS
jgi:hypothetical protein